MEARLPVELIRDILVLAASSPDIDNRQRIALCRVSHVGFVAIHRHVLLPSVTLTTSVQVKAFAQTLQRNICGVHDLARRYVRQLQVEQQSSRNSHDSGGICNHGFVGGQPVEGVARTSLMSRTFNIKPAPALYDQAQTQNVFERQTLSHLRDILKICQQLDRLVLHCSPSALDYRLTKTISSARAPHGPFNGRKASSSARVHYRKSTLSHAQHARLGTRDELEAFRGNLSELVCLQNVLGGGDFLDQLSIFDAQSGQLPDLPPALPPLSGPNPTRFSTSQGVVEVLNPSFAAVQRPSPYKPPSPPSSSRWSRLIDVQLHGPRFRLTMAGARALALGLPALERLALIMPGIAPADNALTPASSVDPAQQEGMDLFARMSPLQLLLDLLQRTSDSGEEGANGGHHIDHERNNEANAVRPRGLRHFLFVSHDVSQYIGSAEKIRSWLDGLHLRVQVKDDEESIYADRRGRSATTPPTPTPRCQPRVRLVIARPRNVRSTAAPSAISSSSSRPDDTRAHPTLVSQWMMERASKRTHWRFGPDVDFAGEGPGDDGYAEDTDAHTRPAYLPGGGAMPSNVRLDDGIFLGDHVEDVSDAFAHAVQTPEVYADEDEQMEYTLEEFELPITEVVAIAPLPESPSEPATSAPQGQAAASLSAPVTHAHTPMTGMSGPSSDVEADLYADEEAAAFDDGDLRWDDDTVDDGPASSSSPSASGFARHDSNSDPAAQESSASGSSCRIV